MTSRYERVDGAGSGQLERMRDLASRIWSRSSRWHPGELTWFWWQHGAPLPTWRVATWRTNGTTIAWAWSKTPGHLDLQIDPAHPDALDLVLTWFHEAAEDQRQIITVTDVETDLVDALTSRGWVLEPAEVFFDHLRLDLADLPSPSRLPPGTTLRPVDGGSDAELRAALHRRAFGLDAADGEPTAETYRRLMSDRAYRSGLDWIAVSSDGTPAAFCLSWIDEPRAVAVLEPVGTDPRYRRRGLARAVIVASLRAAADLGARHARVCARGDGGDPAPIATYASIGFRRYARNVRLARSSGARRSNPLPQNHQADRRTDA